MEGRSWSTIHRDTTAEIVEASKSAYAKPIASSLLFNELTTTVYEVLPRAGGSMHLWHLLQSSFAMYPCPFRQWDESSPLHLRPNLMSLMDGQR